MPGRHTLNPGTRTVLAKSCSTCGDFKQASEFRMSRGKWLQSQCKKCQHTAAKKSNQRTNGTSRDRAYRNNQPWTLAEVRQLEAYLQQGVPLANVAYRLNRTLFGVNSAIRRYELDRKEE